MAIVYKKNRTVVSCQGDIRVEHYTGDLEDFDGVGWVLMQVGPEGIIGRRTDRQGTVDLSTCSGVLVGVKDPVSCDVLEGVFRELGKKLRAAKAELARTHQSTLTAKGKARKARKVVS